MPIEQICQFIIIACLFFTLLGTFESLISNFIGIVYPAFKSFEAIESEDKNDEKQWLIYWVCFACFTVSDQVVGRLVLKKIVPFYFFIKIGFLVFLFHPRT